MAPVIGAKMEQKNRAVLLLSPPSKRLTHDDGGRPEYRVLGSGPRRAKAAVDSLPAKVVGAMAAASWRGPWRKTGGKLGGPRGIRNRKFG